MAYPFNKVRNNYRFFFKFLWLYLVAMTLHIRESKDVTNTAVRMAIRLGSRGNEHGIVVRCRILSGPRLLP